MTQALYMSFFQDYGVYLTLSPSDIPKLSGVTSDWQSLKKKILIPDSSLFFLNIAFTAAWLTLLRHQIDRQNFCCFSFSEVWGILNVAVMFPMSSWCHLFPLSSSDIITLLPWLKLNTILHKQVCTVSRRILNFKEKRCNLSFFCLPP